MCQNGVYFNWTSGMLEYFLMEKEKYQSYINNFRRRISPYLKQNIGIKCNVYPSKDGGGILEFTIGQNLENEDIYKDECESLGDALSQIEQKAFGGNLRGFTFGGTNTILEPSRIIFIKEANLNEWHDNSAAKDVGNMVSASRKPKI